MYIRTCKHYICASAHCTKWTVKAVLGVVYVRTYVVLYSSYGGIHCTYASFHTCVCVYCKSGSSGSLS